MSFLGLELPMSDDEFKMAVAAVCLLVALVLQGIVSRRSSKPAQVSGGGTRGALWRVLAPYTSSSFLIRSILIYGKRRPKLPTSTRLLR
jgi:hypothetical protein